MYVTKKDAPYFFGLIATVLLLPIAVYSIYGMYYEEYESLFTLLLSGQLTPGITYDNLYYMAHIGGLSHVYSFFYKTFPHISWLNWINLLYMMLAVGIIFRALVNISVPKYVIPLGLFIACLLAENFMLFNMTRTSFLVCFAALLGTSMAQPPYRWAKIAATYLFFCIGIFTRVESGVFALALFVGMLPIMPSRQGFLKNLTLIIGPALLACACMFWITWDIGKSDEFYKQIEPDVEYELAVKGNFIPRSGMKTPTDSIRYEAIIDRGIWGDAKTNDITFLRSLINPDGKGMLSIRSTENLFNPFIEIISKRPSLFAIHLCVFMATLLLFAYHKPKHIWKPLACEAFFLFFIWFIGHQLKMAERIYVPLTCIATVILIFACVDASRQAKKLSPVLFIVPGILLCAYHFTGLQKIADNHSYSYDVNSANWQKVKTATHGHALFLNGESLGYLLLTQRPFKNFGLPSEKLYLFNTLAMTTIRPYKDYLEKECLCNVADYGSFFTFMRNLPSPKPVFVMSESHKTFMETYMLTIHHQDITWTEFPTGHMEVLAQDFMPGSTPLAIKAYTMNP